MNKKSLPIAVLLLSVGVLCAFKIQTAKAWSGTVTIRGDGSISPPEAPIQQNGSVYTLTDDIVVPCPTGPHVPEIFGIWIEKDGVTLDGAGHTLQGPEINGTWGIEARCISNVTVARIAVRHFMIGIDVFGLHCAVMQSQIANNYLLGIDLGGLNCRILENNITANNEAGLSIRYGGTNDIIGNSIEANVHGIAFHTTMNNTVMGNIFKNNGVGIHSDDSLDNLVYHNSFVNNTCGAATGPPGPLGIWSKSHWTRNYWSDYNGTDSYGDGIGDTPYVIDSNNTDYHPLMFPHWFNYADIDGDGKVDIRDVAIMSAAFGSSPGFPRWNQACDINHDSRIDIIDLARTSANFGWHR